MTLFDLLTRVRDYYVDRFREQLKAEPENSEQRFQAEDVVVGLNGKPQTEGFLDLPMRIDLLIIEGKEASKTIIVDTEKLLAFQPVSIMWQHLPVRIAPFKMEFATVYLHRRGSLGFMGCAQGVVSSMVHAARKCGGKRTNRGRSFSF